MSNNRRMDRLAWSIISIVFLGLGTLILAFNAIFPSGNTFRLEVGEVVPQDIYAPDDLAYISDVRTEQAREQARAAVGQRYADIPDVGIQQLDLLQNILEYIDLVRNNPYISSEQKLADLQAIEALSSLNEATWTSIRDASDADWQDMSEQMDDVLDRTYRGAITPEQVEIERNLLSTRVEASFSDAEEAIIVALVSQLIIPNRAYDEESTLAAQETAAAAVEPEGANWRQGELIARKGAELLPEQRETLEQFGLLQRTEDKLRVSIGALVLMIATGAAMVMYLDRFYPEHLHNRSMLALQAILFLEFLAGARVFGPDGFDQAYLFPAAAMALLMTTLIGPHFATVATAALAVLVATMFDENAFTFAMQIAIGGFVGILVLGKSERQSAYFFSGLVIGVANMAIVVSSALMGSEDPVVFDIIGDSMVAMIGGVFAAGIAFVELGVISTVMNLTTSVRLVDLMRPDQPLLQRLLREAPGTFQHSLQVANLGELAAERIEADATLVRVAAMYHDIGKILNPHFFIENQKGVNPHTTIDDPQRSAQILISHVTEGNRMARRYRLPSRLRDFIREHHGTTRPYFYYKALELADGDTSKVNADDYTYPGPSPQSKETALLMLADSIESAARGIQPGTEEEVMGVVNMIFEKVLQEGQLDESNLTLNDLKAIREVFIDTLQGIYHTRIKYPGQEEKLMPKEPPQIEEKSRTAEVPVAVAVEAEPVVAEETVQVSEPPRSIVEKSEMPAVLVTEQVAESVAEVAETVDTFAEDVVDDVGEDVVEVAEDIAVAEIDVAEDDDSVDADEIDEVTPKENED